MKYKITVIFPDKDGNFELPDRAILLRALPPYGSNVSFRLRVLVPIDFEEENDGN